jgi:hypothetical protein
MINNFLGSLLGLNFYVYGLGVFLTLVLFLFLFWRLLRKTALNEEKMMDALFAAGIFALVFGRAAYVATHYQFFKGSWLSPFLLVNYPGVNEFFFWLSFLVYWLIYTARKKITLGQLVKVLMPPIVFSKLLLSLFSLIKEPNLALMLELAILPLLIAIYLAVNKFAVNKSPFKDNPWLSLVLYLAIPNFVIDFFKDDKVYFLGQKLVSFDQSLFATAALAVVIATLIKQYKKK